MALYKFCIIIIIFNLTLGRYDPEGV